MRDIKAVVFDMDGVILDSEKIYRKYEYVAAEKYGLPMEKMEDFCNSIAGGTKYTNSKVFDEFFDIDMSYMEYREVVTAGVESYARENGYELKPGVKELLSYLKENGYKIALATSTSETRAKIFLEPHGIIEYFDKMIFGDSIPPGRGKPNPDVYLIACDALGTEPAETIGVEDSRNGIRSCRAAGLFTVMVPDVVPVDDEMREKADEIFDSLVDIKTMLEESK